MATDSKLLNLISKFLLFLPDVPRANQQIPFHKKLIYTAISLFAFLVGSQVPLHGIQPASGADSFYWERLVLASNAGTFMTLGITPILMPEIAMQLFMKSKIFKMDNSAPEARMLLNRAQKFLGILGTIVRAVTYVLCKPGTGNGIIIMLQIIFSGVVVIYLDDFLKKGYGLLPGISLFTAANICEIVLWKAFSPYCYIYHGQCAEFEGAVIAWIHLLITRTDKLYAMHEVFCRQNLPNITNLLATCLFLPIAIFFHGIYVVLPVRTRDLPFQVNCPIKLSNLSYAPVVFHRLLVSLLYDISRLLFIKYGENKFVNLLGKWKGPKQIGHLIPVGGIVHYLTTTPTLADLWRDPVHAFLYITFVLSTCAFASEFWFKVCASSKRFLTGLLGGNERQRVMPAQPDSMSLKEFNRYLAKTARFGGFCVGALIILADLIGVISYGTGVMLAVSSVYPYLDGRAGEVSVFGL